MSKQFCKVCGKTSDSDYCFIHKPKKKIFTKPIDKLGMEEKSFMREFFVNVWKKRDHSCENCKTYLGSVPLSYMFDHVLEKSKYPHLKYEEENIWILCLECHTNKTNCNLNTTMKEKIKKVKENLGV